MPARLPVPLDIERRVAERLRQARVTRKLTQEQVARRVGLSQALVHNYETLRTRVNLTTLIRLAQFYSLPASWFFEDSEAPASELGDFVLSMPLGRRLVEAFAAIDHHADRGVVVDVAEAIVRRPAAAPADIGETMAAIAARLQPAE